MCTEIGGAVGDSEECGANEVTQFPTEWCLIGLECNCGHNCIQKSRTSYTTDFKSLSAANWETSLVFLFELCLLQGQQ